MRVVTPKEMNEIDRLMSEKYMMPVRVLMENAGYAIASHIMEKYPDAGKIVFVTGSGNNGGDGWSAARILFAEGYKVQIVSLCSENKMKDAVRENYLAADALGIGYVLSAGRSELLEALLDSGIIVDCIAGTGLKGGLNEETRELAELINKSGKTVISVDVPSGVDAETGLASNGAVKADTLIVLGTVKEGLLFYPARSYFDNMVICPISIPEAVYDELTGYKAVYTDKEIKKLIHCRKPASHKGDYGRLGIIAGSEGMTGAACLAADSALKSGAGLIYVAVPESLGEVFEKKLTEQIKIKVPETKNKAISASKELYDFADTKTSLVIGPGLSRNCEASVFIPEILKTFTGNVIIDADGLNCIAQNPECLKSAEGRVVITPHIGEMSRLCGKTIAEITEHQKETALDFAEKYNCVVVLKNYITVIASPDGRVIFNVTGNSGMATGGSGDVLSGLIGSLLSQNYPPFEAAFLGGYINGRAAELAAKVTGEASLTPTDTLNSIPAVFRLLV